MPRTAIGDLLPFEDRGGLAQVLDPAVRAAADVDLVDLVPASSRIGLTWSGL
jgi:hypothetical protein